MYGRMVLGIFPYYWQIGSVPGTHTVHTAKITDRTFIISAIDQVINYRL